MAKSPTQKYLVIMDALNKVDDDAPLGMVNYGLIADAAWAAYVAELEETLDGQA